MASERPEAEARRESADSPDVAASARPKSSPPEAQPEVRSAPESDESAQDSTPPPASDRPSQPPGEGGPRRSRFENILPGLIRRGIEKGIEAGLHTIERSVETAAGTTDAVRGVFSEVKLPRDVANAVGRALTEAKLPREIASAVFNQFDETKNDVLRIVAGEVRDFLEATDLAPEVRFIPNDAGTGVRPDVRARSRIKRVEERERRRATRRRGERREEPPATEDEGESA